MDKDKVVFEDLSAVAQLQHLQALYVNFDLVPWPTDVSEMVSALLSSDSACRSQLRTLHLNSALVLNENSLIQLQHLRL